MDSAATVLYVEDDASFVELSSAFVEEVNDTVVDVEEIVDSADSTSR